MRIESVGLVVLLWVLAVAAAADQTAVVEKHLSTPEDGDVTESRSAVKDTGTRTTREEDINHKGEVEAKEEPTSKNDDLAEKADKTRFLGRYTTTTEVAVVMVTSTVFYSCLSGTSMALCMGRRRKKDLLPLTELHFDHNEG